MIPQPDGMVDPASEAEVATVLDAVLRTMGTGGVLDVLARLPGVRVQPGSPKRFLSPAEPTRAWVGAEDCWVLDDAATHPIEHQQTVSGVVLHREVLPPARVGAVLAGQLVRLIGDYESHDEASLVLTGAWEAARS